MKDQPANSANNDELDLIQIFDYIGKGIRNILEIIFKFFKAVFLSLLLLFKTIVDNIIIILITLGIAFGLGLLAENLKTPIYKSEMLVEPHFDSKYQLVSNINYYNALIDDKNHAQLSKIFNIDQKDAKQLIKFEIEPGPETKNDLIKQFDEFMKSIDSLRGLEISFEDFVENRDLYNGEIFLIEVTSTKKDIFKTLESGLYDTFENKFAIEQKRKRDSLLKNRRDNYVKSIQEIDSLQKVYINVLKEESKNKISTVKISEGLLPLEQEKRETKEYELQFRKEQLRDSIRAVDGKQIDENTFFDVVSSFQSIGTKNRTLMGKYSIIFPIIAFVGLCLFFFVYKTIIYIKKSDI